MIHLLIYTSRFIPVAFSGITRGPVICIRPEYKGDAGLPWHWVFAGVWVLAAVLLDVLLNYTLLALMTLDFPQRREYTFSQRLERLVRDTGWRGVAARATAFILNPFDPSPEGHIRL